MFIRIDEAIKFGTAQGNHIKIVEGKQEQKEQLSEYQNAVSQTRQ